MKRQLDFGSFRLDEVNECLWRGARAIALRPKTYALLKYMIDRSGRLVAKHDLLRDVWEGTNVGDAVLKGAISELRSALDDSARDPAYIETVHRRGYRFLVLPTVNAAEAKAPAPSLLAGRVGELEFLQNCLQRSSSGTREVVFVTGPPGIGKTALVETFLDGVRGAGDVHAATGQCLEHYGTGEAYLPFLDAVSRLCRQPGGRELLEIMRARAPTWLVQMPGLLEPGESEALQRQTLGATRERMIRELAEALEAWTAIRPLLLLLEDLHWSDASTLDLVAHLARRPDPARLLVVGTYRPVDVLLENHPLYELKRELVVRRACRELSLEFLGKGAIADLVARRFPGHRFPEPFPEWIHDRTDGSPFFVVNILDYLVDRGEIVRTNDVWTLAVDLDQLDHGVPESLRVMIERQTERCSSRELSVLQAASLLNPEFTSVAVASAVELDLTEVEALFDALAARGLLVRPAGVRLLPNGIETSSYRFIHTLYQDVLREGLTPAVQRAFRRRMGTRGEEIYGSRSVEIAAELAAHFEQGLEIDKAVEYLRIAAGNAYRRYANREAIGYLNRALRMLEGKPGVEAACLRSRTMEQLGMVYRSAGDMPRAAEAFADMGRQAANYDRVAVQVRAELYAAGAYSWFESERCLSGVRRAVDLTNRCDDALERACAHALAGYWSILWSGWSDEQFWSCAEGARVATTALDHRISSVVPGRFAFLLSLRSQYSAARGHAEQGMQRALENGDSFEFLLFRFYLAWALLFGGERREMRRVLEEGIEMADRNGHGLWAILMRVELAWLYQRSGRTPIARQLVGEALVSARAEGYGLGQLFGEIVRGHAALDAACADEAEEAFAQAERLLDGDVMMKWIQRMPLLHGRARLALSQGDFELAENCARELLELAATPGEITFGGLARHVLAESALAQHDLDRAEVELAHGARLLERSHAPIASTALEASRTHFRQVAGREAPELGLRLQALDRNGSVS